MLDNIGCLSLLTCCLFIGDSMRQRIKFTDERVCKSHLLDSCPHDILSGTVSTCISYIALTYVKRSRGTISICISPEMCVLNTWQFKI